jgi:hypothetical protein
VAILDPRVLRALFGIVLKLVVAPTMPADIVSPPVGVGQSGTVELIGPNE